MRMHTIKLSSNLDKVHKDKLAYDGGDAKEGQAVANVEDCVLDAELAGPTLNL